MQLHRYSWERTTRPLRRPRALLVRGEQPCSRLLDLLVAAETEDHLEIIRTHQLVCARCESLTVLL